MPKRKIIEIDRDKCTGCGMCIPDCPEGALQIIDGKATLVSDLMCDGLGACVGSCQTGAMKVVEKEAEQYDEKKVMIESIIPKGLNVIIAHLEHLINHNEEIYLEEAVEVMRENGYQPENLINSLRDKNFNTKSSGCPGNQSIHLKKESVNNTVSISNISELANWPVQLKLINPNAPYFNNSDLLICADCVPFAYPDFHSRFLKNKIVINFCPKLDSGIEEYIDKMKLILENNNINSITILHMEVPCCGGTVKIAYEALKRSTKNIIIRDYMIGIDGNIK